MELVLSKFIIISFYDNVSDQSARQTADGVQKTNVAVKPVVKKNNKKQVFTDLNKNTRITSKSTKSFHPLIISSGYFNL